jgi:hypothetical protein
MEVNQSNTRQFKKKVTLSHVYNEVTSEPTLTRYASIVKKTLKVCFNWRGKVFLYPERLLLWSRHFATRSPLAAAARNTFPRQLQTNFESFPNNCSKSRESFWITLYKLSPGTHRAFWGPTDLASYDELAVMAVSGIRPSSIPKADRHSPEMLKTVIKYVPFKVKFNRTSNTPTLHVTYILFEELISDWV